ncbi:SH3 domain-containing protein [Seohaeicola saemankumensis]|nr:SH3 domain-containing protein [Seohaeicola saemankumensis]MCA0873698.1 SH3 domain-containing protein [Seohaeicola saemankumensis]
MKKSAAFTAVFCMGFAGVAIGAEVSQDAIDACIEVTRSEASGGGGHILRTEFSEANSLVVLQDGNDNVWRCLVSNDGVVQELTRSDEAPVHAATTGDYADGMSGGPDYWRINVHSTLNVHSDPSTSSRTVARLHRGMVVENRGCVFNEGRKWCEIADGDASGWAAGEYLVEAAAPARSSSQASAAAPTTQTVIVRFASGTNGQQQAGSLSPGSSIRFVLEAANRQMLEVSFVNTDPAIQYQIFLPNGRLLLDQVPNTLPYQGELYMNGEHVVEVINRGHNDARFSVWMGIW